MSKTSTKMSGSKKQGMGILGTFQLKRESIECAMHSEKTGVAPLSREDSEAIGEVKLLRKKRDDCKTVEVLSLDTGTLHTGYSITRHKKNKPPEVLDCGISMNGDIKYLICGGNSDAIVMENFQCMGMPVGLSTFNSAVWLGRFIEASLTLDGRELVWLMHRSAVKVEICGTPRAKDANIRQAIIDMYPDNIGGGKCPQVGTSKQRGPLYGVTSHVWSALALAISFDKTVLSS